ncbi:MAG: hypothetical protein ABEJ04_07670 [Halobacteriaceae archaeon]
MPSIDDLLRERAPDEVAFEHARQYGGPSIRKGTWLTTDLWSEHGWDEVLESAGVEWSEFAAAYDAVSDSFVAWKRDEKPWDEAMDDLVREVSERR